MAQHRYGLKEKMMSLLESRFHKQLDEINDKNNKGTLKVRYIKLGKGGEAFEECLEKKLLYIGFGTECSDVRSWCNDARNDDEVGEAKEKIRNFWIKKRGKKDGTATNFTNSVLEVARDKGDTLWITIENRRIYYGLSAGGELEYYAPWAENGFNSGSAKNMKYGWCDQDSEGKPLDINKISGALTKTQGSQVTIAKIEEDISDYFINLLFGGEIKLKAEAETVRNHLTKVLAKIIQDLQWSEFEVLVDLIFANSGWKRDGELGGNIKFVDVTLKLPSTNETAGVQVKSRAKKKEFLDYIEKDYSNQNFDKFFYVYHKDALSKEIIPEDPNFHVWDAEEVTKRAIDAGLSQWIIDRAYR